MVSPIRWKLEPKLVCAGRRRELQPRGVRSAVEIIEGDRVRARGGKRRHAQRVGSRACAAVSHCAAVGRSRAAARESLRADRQLEPVAAVDVESIGTRGGNLDRALDFDSEIVVGCRGVATKGKGGEVLVSRHILRIVVAGQHRRVVGDRGRAGIIDQADAAADRGQRPRTVDFDDRKAAGVRRQSQSQVELDRIGVRRVRVRAVVPGAGAGHCRHVVGGRRAAGTVVRLAAFPVVVREGLAVDPDEPRPLLQRVRRGHAALGGGGIARSTSVVGAAVRRAVGQAGPILHAAHQAIEERVLRGVADRDQIPRLAPERLKFRVGFSTLPRRRRRDHLVIVPGAVRPERGVISRTGQSRRCRQGRIGEGAGRDGQGQHGRRVDIAGRQHMGGGAQGRRGRQEHGAVIRLQHGRGDGYAAADLVVARLLRGDGIDRLGKGDQDRRTSGGAD